MFSIMLVIFNLQFIPDLFSLDKINATVGFFSMNLTFLCFLSIFIKNFLRKGTCDPYLKKADQEKQSADHEHQRADQEHQRADQEQQRADIAEQRIKELQDHLNSLKKV